MWAVRKVVFCCILAAAVVNSDLISYYSFNNVGDVVAGSCTDRQDIPTPSGIDNPSIAASGCFDDSCFDLRNTGTNPGIDLGSYTFAGSAGSLNSFSVSFHTSNDFGTGSTEPQPLLIKPGTLEIRLDRQGGNTFFEFKVFLSGGSVETITYTKPNNNLAHYVLTLSSTGSTTDIQLIVNGAVEASRSPAGTFADSASNMVVGCSGTCATLYDGVIDELAFFDEVLTDSQIASLDVAENYPITSPSDPVVAKSPSGDPEDSTNGEGLPVFNLALGDSLALQVTGPSGTYTWDAGQSASCQDLLVITNEDTSTPTIETTSVDDIGEVEVTVCNINTFFGGSNSKIVINVQPSEPTIVAQPSPSSISANTGEEVSISVVVSGRPPPFVNWQKLQLVTVNCTDNNGTFVCPNSTRRSYDSSLLRSLPRLTPQEYQQQYGRSWTTMDEHIDEIRGPTGNSTVVLESWVNIEGAVNETYSFIAGIADEGRYRASVFNGVSNPIFSEEVEITVLSGPSDGGDGGDGDSSLVGAIGGAAGAGVVGLILCCCCIVCCLFICLIVAIALGTAGGSSQLAAGGLKIDPPDWDLVTYGKYLQPMFEDMKSHKEMIDSLERLFIESGTSVARVLLATADTSSLDGLAKALAIIYDQNGMAVDLLKDQITYEVDESHTESTMFRANSPVAKMFSFWVKIVGLKFIWRLFVRPVQRLTNLAGVENIDVNDSDDDVSGSMKMETKDMFGGVGTMEIDTNRITQDGDDEGDLSINVLELKLTIQKILKTLLAQRKSFPDELAFVLRHVHDCVSARHDFSEMAVYRAIGSFLFLRYVCPVLTAPHVWGLLTELPDPSSQRTLILISKVMQNLANNTLPGTKESYMEPMDSIITENVPRVEKFYSDLLSGGDSFEPVLHTDQPVALNNAVIIVHKYLCGAWSSISGHLRDDDEAQDHYLSFEEVVSSYAEGTKL